MKTKNIISIVLFVIAAIMLVWVVFLGISTVDYYDFVQEELAQSYEQGEHPLSPFFFIASLLMLLGSAGVGLAFSVPAAVLAKIKTIKICTFIEIAFFSLVAIGTAIVYITI